MGKKHELIADSRLLTFLQKHITENHPNTQTLKKYRYCGSQFIPTIAPAVFVISNQKQSRITGVARCHSSWGCPICTPKRMAEYGSRIACAIDALKSKYKMQPFMMTCTIPHHKWMDIKATYTILQNTWRKFSKECNPIRTAQYILKKNVTEDGRAVGIAGTKVTYRKTYRAPFPNMRKQLEITHNIRVYEFTWSENNGWHPHIHALFWLPTKNFSKLNDGWEQKLADYWWNLAEKEALKYYAEKYPDKQNQYKSMVQHIFNEYRRLPKSGHRTIYFSKYKNGKVRPITSSQYLNDWGGDMELANGTKQKTAADGHYTPHELLETAYKDPTQREKFMNLYLDYLKITFGKRRIMFSPKTGLNKIIQEWRKTNTWFETLKKKLMAKDAGNWKVVAWFTSEQWLQICYNYLQADIMELSILPDAREQIAHFLLQYNIKVSTKKHHDEDFMNNTLFENTIHKGTVQQANHAIENQRRSITYHQAMLA